MRGEVPSELILLTHRGAPFARWLVVRGKELPSAAAFALVFPADLCTSAPLR
jgi:hypothetical protein